MTILSPDFWIFVGVIAGIYTIFALGLQLQLGFAGLLNFGHVAFMAVGAYTMAILIVKVDVPMWVAAPIAIGAAMLFGLLLGLPTLRLRADYLAITMVAVSEIVRHLGNNLQSLTGGPQGTINLRGSGTAASFNTEWRSFQGTAQDWLEVVVGDLATRNFTMLVLVWIVALGILLLLQVSVRSPWGRVLKAVREDEDAASALGKNVFWYKLQALALGGGIAAVAGLFYAFQFSFFAPKDFEPLLTFFAWIIVLLGGVGRNWGVPLGAVLFGVLFAGTRFFDIPFLSDADQAFLRLFIIGLVLVLLMAFRPQGILGKREEMILEHV